MIFRPMTRQDIGDVLLIERSCFQFPWPREDFVRALDYGRCVVVTEEKKVVAHAVYERHKGMVSIRTIAVALQARRRGIATSVIDMATTFARSVKADTVVSRVRETNVSAQLFFRSLGFLAVRIDRDAYRDFGLVEDCYVMQLKLSKRRG